MSAEKTLEVPIKGMDCAECTMHVQHAISELPGVESVNVFLTSEKAIVHLDPDLVDVPAIRKAVEGAGYSVPEFGDQATTTSGYANFTRSVLTLLGLVFGAVLFIIVVGEWLGLFETLTARVPFLVGLAIVLVAGFPVFRNVIRVCA